MNRDDANERLRREAVRGGKKIASRVDEVEDRVEVLEERVDEIAPPPPSRPRPLVEEPSTLPHRDAALERQRTRSELELELEGAMAGFIGYARKADAGQAALGRAVAVLARELGVVEQLDPELRRTLPPPLPTAPKRATVARTNTRSYLAAIAAATAGGIELAIKLVELIERHQHHL